MRDLVFRFMVKKTIALMFAVSTLLLAGCYTAHQAAQSGEPRRETSAPLVAILKAAKKSDAAAFRDAYSTRIHLEDQQTDWERNLREAQATLKQKFGDYRITDFAFSFEGDATTGKLEVSFKGKAQFAIAVVKEGGAWKLDER